MSIIAHKFYAGSGAHWPGPLVGKSYAARMSNARAHGSSLPKHWVADRMTVLLLPAAIALMGVLGAILCSLVRWN
jgi:hypothetical protein